MGKIKCIYSDGEEKIFNEREKLTEEEITHVVVEDGVTEILEEQFYSCNQLEDVKLPSSIKKINETAFLGCYNLKDIELKEGLEFLGERAFGLCTSLNRIKLPNSLVKISSGAFLTCKSLKEIVIPNNVESIEHSCFSNCLALESVTLPKNLKTLEGFAFYQCESLKNINLPENLEKIEQACFSYCTELDNIILPNGIKKLTRETFSWCLGLKNITLPQNLEYIDYDCFSNCRSLEKIELPAKLKVLGNYVFSGCSELKDIKLPEGLIELGYSCFRDCDSLTIIHLPQSVEKIGSNCFYRCNNLKEIAFPNKIVTIPSACFDGCISLEHVALHSNIAEIEDMAFINCVSIKEISIPQNCLKIGALAFANCVGLEDIKLPDGLDKLNDSLFFNCVKLQHVTLPANLKELSTEAFMGCKSLEEITFPESVEGIGSSCFNGCLSLEKMVLPSKLKVLKSGTFYGCSSLKEVVLPDSLQKIGDYVFRDCSNLTSLKIPDSVKKIGKYAFKDSGLTRIQIPTNCECDFKTFKGSNLEYIYLKPNGEIILTKERDENLAKTANEKQLSKDGSLFFDVNYKNNLLKVQELKNAGKVKFIPPDYTLKTLPNGDIENYFFQNNNLRYGKLVKALGFDKLGDDSKENSLTDLMKLYYAIGGFSTNQGESEMAYNYILTHVAKVGKNYDAEEFGYKVHGKFSKLNILDNEYNPDFAKFFMKYYKDNADFMNFMLPGRDNDEPRDYICLAHNSFRKIQESYPNMTINGTSRVSVLTPEFVAEHCIGTKYDEEIIAGEEVQNKIMGIAKYNQSKFGVDAKQVYDDIEKKVHNLADLLSRYGYNEDSFVKMRDMLFDAIMIKDEAVIKADNINQNNPVTFRVLDKDDMLGFVVGDITNCCQHIGSAGESCVVDGFTNKNSGFIVFEQNTDDGINGLYGNRILGQAYVWYDEKTKTVCLDNIEVPTRVLEELKNSYSKVKVDDFIKAVDACAKSLASTMNRNGIVVNRVTTGRGYNDLANYLNRGYSVEVEPIASNSTDVYSDARQAQYILLDNFVQENLQDEEPETANAVNELTNEEIPSIIVDEEHETTF